MTDHLPDDLEERVRDAYQSAARTVQTLQRPCPMLAAGSVPRPRRMNALIPLAAAMAVIVVIGASVALPRLLTGASQNPAAPGISASSKPATQPNSTPASTAITVPAPAATSPAPAPHSPKPALPSFTTSPSCPATLTEGNDGTITPLFCSDGSPNPAALAYYEGHNDRGFNPTVLRLAPSSTQSQVKSAMCADIGPGGTMGLQTEQQAYDLAARRNSWSYDINTVTNLRCPPAG